MTMKNKKDNIAEYILWLWQLEDYLRAFPPTESSAGKAESSDIQFLSELQEMMHREGVMDGGHVQLAQNALRELEELHALLSEEDAMYRAAVIRITPLLNIFKSKTDRPTMSDVEACLTLLYQVMLLRLQQKDISASTVEVQQQATQLLQFLSRMYYTNFQISNE